MLTFAEDNEGADLFTFFDGSIYDGFFFKDEMYLCRVANDTMGIFSLLAFSKTSVEAGLFSFALANSASDLVFWKNQQN